MGYDWHNAEQGEFPCLVFNTDSEGNQDKVIALVADEETAEQIVNLLKLATVAEALFEV